MIYNRDEYHYSFTTAIHRNLHGTATVVTLDD